VRVQAEGREAGPNAPIEKYKLDGVVVPSTQKGNRKNQRQKIEGWMRR